MVHPYTHREVYPPWYTLIHTRGGIYLPWYTLRHTGRHISTRYTLLHTQGGIYHPIYTQGGIYLLREVLGSLFLRLFRLWEALGSLSLLLFPVIRGSREPF